MAGFRNSGNIDVLFVDNVDFTGAAIPSPTMVTDGQLIIGSTAAPNMRINTLTAGTGVSIVNGAGNITINASGGGVSWINVTGTTQTISASHGYLSNNSGTITFTLPATSTLGDVFRIAGVQGSWTVAQNANQQIKFGNASTTIGVGGSIASTNEGDCIELVATNTSSNSVWKVISSVGNITIV